MLCKAQDFVTLDRTHSSGAELRSFSADNYAICRPSLHTHFTFLKCAVCSPVSLASVLVLVSGLCRHTSPTVACHQNRADAGSLLCSAQLTTS